MKTGITIMILALSSPLFASTKESVAPVTTIPVSYMALVAQMTSFPQNCSLQAQVSADSSETTFVIKTAQLSETLTLKSDAPLSYVAKDDVEIAKNDQFEVRSHYAENGVVITYIRVKNVDCNPETVSGPLH